MKDPLEAAVAQAFDQIDALIGDADYAQAIGRASELRERLRLQPAERQPDYVRVLHTLGYLYSAVADFAESVRHYRKALEVGAQLGLNQGADHAITLLNLAVVYKTLGDFAEAEPLYVEARNLLRETMGPEDPQYLTSLNNLAELYRAMGRYADAEPLYKEAVRTGMVVFGLGHPSLSGMLGNLGLLYQAMGRYADAQTMLMQSADGYHDYYGGTDHPDYARSLNNLGMLFQELGNASDAETYHREALRIRHETLGPAHLDTAQSANNLGSVYASRDDFETAEPLLRFALDVRRRLLGDENALVAESLNNLGTLYLSAGRPDLAEPLLSGALEKYRSQLGATHPDLIGSLTNLAGAHVAMTRFDLAEPLLREAVQLASAHRPHRGHAGVLNLLARVMAATGRASEALPLMQQAMAVDDEAIHQYSAAGSDSQRSALLESLRFRLDDALSVVSTYLADSAPAVSAAYDLVLRRKALGLTLEVAVRRMATLHESDVVRGFVRDIGHLRTSGAAQTLAGPSAGVDAAEFERRQQFEMALRNLNETALATELGGVPLGPTYAAANRAGLAAALPEGAALIEWVRVAMSTLGAGAAARRHPARYLAFVLRSGAPDEVRLLDMGDADAIDRAVAAVRAAITGDDEMTGAPLASEGERSDVADDDVVALRAALGNATRHLELSTGKRPTGEADSVASELRTKIWDPLMPAVHQSTRLFLAPDGDLVRIPFEMLPLPDGRRLLEAYELSYLSVGRDLVSSSSGDSQKGTEPIVVANPDFDAGQTGSRVGWPFRHLQNTKLEAELVGRHLGVEPLTGAAASKTAATTVVSPRVLHLATHGVFLPDSVDGAAVPGNQQDARHSVGRLKTRWPANP